jgi:hypothetical protein
VWETEKRGGKSGPPMLEHVGKEAWAWQLVGGLALWKSEDEPHGVKIKAKKRKGREKWAGLRTLNAK